MSKPNRKAGRIRRAVATIAVAATVSVPAAIVTAAPASAGARCWAAHSAC